MRIRKNTSKHLDKRVLAFLPHMRLGVNSLAIIHIMRYLTISYDKIEKPFSMMYRRNLPISRREDADALMSEQLEPVYDDLMAGLKNAEIFGGNETGWYENGRLGWAWVFQTPDAVAFHLSGSHSKAVSEVFLGDFDGITVGDSHPAWNAVGGRAAKIPATLFLRLVPHT